MTARVKQFQIWVVGGFEVMAQFSAGPAIQRGFCFQFGLRKPDIRASLNILCAFGLAQ
jgi:hypothetical protein